MKPILAGILILIGFNGLAQTGSEIYLFDLISKNGAVTLSNPTNITNRKGYDNQPSFDVTNSLVYYSSFNEEGRSDIKTYQYKTGETKSFTLTKEREYSPTLTPDKKFISCIIQRDNNAQDLGKYPISGGDPVIIINNMIVGYHAWMDNDRLALFILGEPNTLHFFQVSGGKDTILAKNIGRSLHKIPGMNAFSYVQKMADKNGVINKVDLKTFETTTITAVITGHEDIAWTPDGTIISSDGEKIFVFTPGVDKAWREADIKAGKDILKSVTRLAVSGDGKKLAVVVSE
jgi:hypothetical protein